MLSQRVLSRGLRTLSVVSRNGTGRYVSKDLREQGLIPGILYGADTLKAPLSWDVRKMEKAQKASVPHTRGDLIATEIKSIEKELRERGDCFENTLYSLKTSDGKEQLVIPRDLQVHVLQQTPTHVSFLKYDPKKGATVSIPLYYSNTEKSPGLLRGGVIHKTIRKIECHVTGKEIPASLEISLEGKAIGDRLYWRDIKFPSCVKPKIPRAIENDLTLVVGMIQGKKEVFYKPESDENKNEKKADKKTEKKK